MVQLWKLHLRAYKIALDFTGYTPSFEGYTLSNPFHHPTFTVAPSISFSKALYSILSKVDHSKLIHPEFSAPISEGTGISRYGTTSPNSHYYPLQAPTIRNGILCQNNAIRTILTSLCAITTLYLAFIVALKLSHAQFLLTRTSSQLFHVKNYIVLWSNIPFLIWNTVVTNQSTFQTTKQYIQTLKSLHGFSMKLLYTIRKFLSSIIWNVF